jgi:hypothetical protein
MPLPLADATPLRKSGKLDARAAVGERFRAARVFFFSGLITFL